MSSTRCCSISNQALSISTLLSSLADRLLSSAKHSHSISSLSTSRTSEAANCSKSCASDWVSIPSVSHFSSAIAFGTLNISSSSSPSSVVVCVFLHFSPPLGDAFVVVLDLLFIAHFSAGFLLPSVALPTGVKTSTTFPAMLHEHDLCAAWHLAHAVAFELAWATHPTGLLRCS